MTSRNDLLNTQWMHEYEQMADIQEVLHKESMKEIRAGFLYIQFSHEKCQLMELIYEDHVRIIDNHVPSETILKLIQEKKRKPFSLQEILLYNVDVAPEHIQKFVQTTPGTQDENETPFLSKVVGAMAVFEPLHIPPSLSIFHSINLLLFVFVDRTSIQLSNDCDKGMTTKKVRFKFPKLKNKTCKR